MLSPHKQASGLLILTRYGTEPFASANGQIPQLNLWDDHDVSVSNLL